jgi:hypothetical protein
VHQAAWLIEGMGVILAHYIHTAITLYSIF